jgi:hypothetical protein
MRLNVSLAAFPRMDAIGAMVRVEQETPSDPLLGALGREHVQVCPQNCGVVTEEVVDKLLEFFPGTRFRLHANARVIEERIIQDLVDFDPASPYWKALARINARMGAHGYSAHAGKRSDASLAQVIENTRRAQDLFGCEVALEGHYPTPNGRDFWLVSSWEEYQAVFESGCAYALDLSHLNIVGTQSRRFESNLVAEMLQSDRCLEIHLSGNAGDADSHKALDPRDPPWWMDLMKHAHPNAVVFFEGNLR